MSIRCLGLAGTVEGTKGLAGELLSESELLLKPESGAVFIEISYTIKGTEKCPATFLGTHNVTGEQAVTIEKAGYSGRNEDR
jgi:hypothetical protein